MIVVMNPDKEYAMELKRQIKSNGGYCISNPKRSKETKCMCKEFKRQESGMCRCGLYMKVEEDDGFN